MSGDTEMFDEWAEGVNVRQLMDEKNARIAELEAKVKRLVGALEEIAAFNDTHASRVLESTGSWGAFDEPGSVAIARRALSGEPT